MKWFSIFIRFIGQFGIDPSVFSFDLFSNYDNDTSTDTSIMLVHTRVAVSLHILSFIDHTKLFWV